MSNRSYRDYPAKLTAGVRFPLNGVGGDYFQVITAAAPVMLIFDSGTQQVTRRQGQGGPANYNRLDLLSTVDQDVVISLGYLDGRAPPYDNNGGLSGATITVAANIGLGLRDPVDVACPAGARTMLIGPDATRFELIVQIPLDAGDGLRLGSSTVGADRGKKVYAGDEVVYTNRGAIYLYNGTAAAVSVSLQENLIP